MNEGICRVSLNKLLFLQVATDVIMACGLLPKFPFASGRSVTDQVDMIQLEDEDVVDWYFEECENIFNILVNNSRLKANDVCVLDRFGAGVPVNILNLC